MTPQTKALKKRKKSGLHPSKPKDTQQRVQTILDLMQRGMWFGTKSVLEHAALWHISSKRVQQLAAEAGRNYG